MVVESLSNSSDPKPLLYTHRRPTEREAIHQVPIYLGLSEREEMKKAEKFNGSCPRANDQPYD